MKKSLVTLGIVGIVGIAVTGCGAHTGTAIPATVTVTVAAAPGPVSSPVAQAHLTGQLLLADSYNNAVVDNGTCEGATGYSDITGGSSVTVEDATGRVIATSSLQAGAATTDNTCTFNIDVQVPSSDFYQVEVSHRGFTAFSRADMHKVDLTVGG